MRIHELKSWTKYFIPLAEGRKTAEFRLNDRDYHVGDVLHLREYNRKAGAYSGRSCLARVTHVLSDPDIGIPEGYVILSLRIIETELSIMQTPNDG